MSTFKFEIIFKKPPLNYAVSAPPSGSVDVLFVFSPPSGSDELSGVSFSVLELVGVDEVVGSDEPPSVELPFTEPVSELLVSEELPSSELSPDPLDDPSEPDGSLSGREEPELVGLKPS